MSQRCLHPTSGICDYVTLCGKKDLADVIKNLNVGKIILDYAGGPNVITRVLNERSSQESEEM